MFIYLPIPRLDISLSCLEFQCVDFKVSLAKRTGVLFKWQNAFKVAMVWEGQAYAGDVAIKLGDSKCVIWHKVNSHAFLWPSQVPGTV